MLPRVNPDVIFQRLEEGAVLFSPATEVYFGLNDVGAFVWERLPPRLHSLDALCEEVHARYPEITMAVIRADVEELLADLLAERLVLDPGHSATDVVAHH